MATVGEILRRVREGKEITLEQIAAEIKIPIRYLKAIEEGKWEDLPAPPYIKGYLRLYASYLGLSPETVIAQYEKDTQPTPIQEIPKEERKFSQKTHYKYAFIISCLFLGLLILFWLVLSKTPEPTSVSDSIKKQKPVKKATTLEKKSNQKIQFSFTTTSPPQKNEKSSLLKVNRIYICKDVKNREPVGVGKVFKLNKTTYLYCFTEILGAKKPVKIKHIWYYKGKPAMTTILPVKGKRWRTWSKKIIFFDLKGEWEVVILGPQKEKLASIKFLVE